MTREWLIEEARRNVAAAGSQIKEARRCKNKVIALRILSTAFDQLRQAQRMLEAEGDLQPGGGG